MGVPQTAPPTVHDGMKTNIIAVRPSGLRVDPAATVSLNVRPAVVYTFTARFVRLSRLRPPFGNPRLPTPPSISSASATQTLPRPSRSLSTSTPACPPSAPEAPPPPPTSAASTTSHMQYASASTTWRVGTGMSILRRSCANFATPRRRRTGSPLLRVATATPTILRRCCAIFAPPARMKREGRRERRERMARLACGMTFVCCRFLLSCVSLQRQNYRRRARPGPHGRAVLSCGRA